MGQEGIEMKKHGWVIQEDGDGGFVDAEQSSETTEHELNSVESAEVYDTRKQARKSDNKLKEDIIRKVELDENGVAVKVIPGR